MIVLFPVTSPQTAYLTFLKFSSKWELTSFLGDAIKKLHFKKKTEGRERVTNPSVKTVSASDRCFGYLSSISLAQESKLNALEI